MKALLRRAAAYEELDDLEHALADSTKVSIICQEGLTLADNAH